MSTRVISKAVIGIKNPDGSIICAWQWNDGDKLTRKLNSHFNTVEKAKKLISYGAWSYMFTADEVEDFEDWLAKSEGDPNFEYLQQPAHYAHVCGLFLRQNENERNQRAVKYRNYTEMLSQAVCYSYLFDTKTNRWVKGKDINI